MLASRQGDAGASADRRGTVSQIRVISWSLRSTKRSAPIP